MQEKDLNDKKKFYTYYVLDFKKKYIYIYI
jgi:hypothetical protein